MEMNLTKTAQHYGSIFELALQKVRYSLRGRFSDANEQNILAGYIEQLLPKNWPRSNLDMESLHSLSPEAGIRFLHEFYTNEAGKYYLAADRESMRGLLAADNGSQTRAARNYARL
jgi:hypothetical protein